MESKRAVEPAEKQQLWEEHFSRWESGGLSQTEYCRQNSIGFHTFQYWKKKLRARPPVPGLIEVPVGLLSPQPNSPLCLFVGSRYRVEITPGFSPDTLECLIRVLNRS